MEKHVAGTNSPVLVDDRGSPIFPSAIPPTTDFPYPRANPSFASSVKHSNTGINGSTAVPTTSPNATSGTTSQTMIGSSQVDENSPTSSSSTTVTPSPPPQQAPPEQAQSPPPKQPSERKERPGHFSAKKSVFGLGRGKKGNNAQRPGMNREVTYNFDPYSDSDTTSSDSEDEGWQAKQLEKRVKTVRGKGGWLQSSGVPSEAEREARSNRQQGRKDSSKPYSRFSIKNDMFKTKGHVSKKDGRLKISVNETANSGYLAKALGAGIKHHLGLAKEEDIDEQENPATLLDERGDRPNLEPLASTDVFEREQATIPKLNIVVIVIGSRGDIQPFLKISKILKEEYGHRVRIATHPAFKEFVEQDSGLEFFSIGGDPSELMAFMVKNPGLIPSMDTIRQGEIGKRRAAMSEMFEGMWRACINATDDEHDKENIRMMGDKHPFVADAIIANPVSFAHVHIAERLGIPLHMMFTFPFTPTSMFPHPLANIKRSNVDVSYTNFISYPLVEMMTWQGLGDLVNRFRVKTLGLEPVSTLWAPGQLYRLKVPYTYMWSPALVPKPPDWGPEIDICGFVFLELASSFKPPEDLTKFLEAGEKPIYIGFGSIVVDDPDAFTHMIFEAVKEAGVRALVSKGWGGIGGEKGDLPDNIYLLDNTPHDWLFPRVRAVVHHGGAGTTAIGLKCAKPTMIVPFFGDQPFWGAMVAEKRAGAKKCVPYKKLNKDVLVEGIRDCLTDEAQEGVQKIADSIAKEGDGAANAVKSFHRSLPLRGERSMRCSIFEDRVAVWSLKKSNLRLSALAAELLVEKKKIKWSNLRLIRHCDWNDFGGPGEPVTGGGGALLGAVTGAAKGIGLAPVKMAQTVKKRKEHEEKKRRHSEKHARAVRSNSTGSNKGTSSDKDPSSTDRPPAQRTNTQLTRTNTQLSADPSEALVEELAHEAGHGFKKTGGAIAKAPMDLSLAVAQGFHNAPRLYGDDTVRRPIRISGFHSGLRAGRDEFVYGIYDGWTGLVTQPYRAVKKGGLLRLPAGIGMGIGGFVLKDIAALIGPIGYFAKGIHMEVRKRHQPTHFIRTARMIQGKNDRRALEQSPDDKREAEEKALKGWETTLELRAAEKEQKEHAGFLTGRHHLRKKRQDWAKHGATESVATTRHAMRADEKGVPIDRAFSRHRKEVQAAQKPREPVMEDKRNMENNPDMMENGRVLSDASGN
ncbi:hypothetical protein H2201_002246 [Coniosporium apollinis]|uniref:Glycosyltransferase family 28 N-terminal domain-containing protein n=1 Tax=Coniosporium apollinis TaxID=61459 RepID=A0ABQ9NZA7_9PEZI|nr:hypothetical protein H2201_002246 [Coniosporium apollinis]